MPRKPQPVPEPVPEPEPEAAQPALDPVVLGSVTADENTGRVVRLWWMDSGLALAGWQPISDLPVNVEMVETVGYWLGQNAAVIAVAQSRGVNGGWLNVQLVARPALVNMEFAL